MYIAIAGNIGSGKTTLTKMLAKQFGWKPHFEPVQVHPNDELAMKRHGCNGKTEMWYVIKSDVGSKIYSGLKESITPEQYEEMATPYSRAFMCSRPTTKTWGTCPTVISRHIWNSSN